MPQNEYIERWNKLHGFRHDLFERSRKRAAREAHKASENAQNLRGLRAKLYAKARHAEKIQMKKQIKAHEERNVKGAPADKEPNNPIPSYLLDRANPTSAKALRWVFPFARLIEANEEVCTGCSWIGSDARGLDLDQS
jgi:ribosome biogenesis protein NSA2